MQRKSPVAVFAAVAALALVSGCERPTHDVVKLKAMKAEAQMLMKAHAVDTTITRGRWPSTIASLEPKFVMIEPDGVHITTRASFDGGWGYFVPREERDVPEPVGRFEEAGQGVYWWHPN